MIKLFVEGGALFMGILTVVLTAIVLMSVFFLYLIIRKDYKNLDLIRSRLKYIKGLGLFALVTGFLGQMIGLYIAFAYIEKAPDISPSIMAGGMKVSMIAPMYGMIIFLISYLLWIGTDLIASRNK